MCVIGSGRYCARRLIVVYFLSQCDFRGASCQSGFQGASDLGTILFYFLTTRCCLEKTAWHVTGALSVRAIASVGWLLCCFLLQLILWDTGAVIRVGEGLSSQRLQAGEVTWCPTGFVLVTPVDLLQIDWLFLFIYWLWPPRWQCHRHSLGVVVAPSLGGYSFLGGKTCQKVWLLLNREANLTWYSEARPGRYRHTRLVKCQWLTRSSHSLFSLGATIIRVPLKTRCLIAGNAGARLCHNKILPVSTVRTHVCIRLTMCCQLHPVLVFLSEGPVFGYRYSEFLRKLPPVCTGKTRGVVCFNNKPLKIGNLVMADTIHRAAKEFLCYYFAFAKLNCTGGDKLRCSDFLWVPLSPN